MFLTTSSVVVSTVVDLKRKYKEVQKLLKNNKVVLISNRNNSEEIDGIFFPYSKHAVSKIEELLEDIEIEKNKKHLEKELKISLKSNKRYSLNEL